MKLTFVSLLRISLSLGFGLFFEWTKTPGSAVSVHISDSEDESCEEEEEHPGNDDVEAVKQVRKTKKARRF